MAANSFWDITENLPGEWTETSWSPPRALTYDEYEVIFNRVRTRRNEQERGLDTLLWWLADVMNNGEMDLGEQFYQMTTGKMLSKESLIKIRRMGEEFPPGTRWRPEEVSFWTHWEVVRIKDDPKQRGSLLARYAIDDDYSRDDLRQSVSDLVDGSEGGGDGGGDSDLPDCPLCSGSGHVTADRREAYLREEGVA